MLEIILINSIFVLFPLLCYLIYAICMQNYSLKKKKFYLDFALISSCYLLIKYGYSYSTMVPKLMFHIPLIFAYLLNRKLGILILSLVGIYYYSSYNFGLYIILIEYVIYYILYILKQKYKRFDFLYIRLFVFTNTVVSFLWLLTDKTVLFTLSWQLIVICLLYYFLICLVVNIFKKSEQITNMYNSLKDLQNLKNLRESIFKITHEIKNPIAVCKGYLDMFQINNKEHNENYIPIIKEEINRTLVLLQDFLSLNKVTIEKDILDINLLIEDVIDNFHLLSKEKNIIITYKNTDDEIFINGDYNRIVQVLINVIKNSIEAIEANGIIKIELNNNEDEVEILVHDNGPGMDSETLEKIKQLFFTTKQNGTGLGVALSNEIVEAHGGKMKYTSIVNKGTTVLITLKKH